mmetsp:Transcript_3537/g.7501  ORF Transcript_3537/g.7501 Transcript_3537/m.7501 type:complete len:537 (+) Transcript_3537:1192-2802(+)
MSVSRSMFEKPDDVRESLLTRCRETIEALSSEVEEERQLRFEAEAECRSLKRQLEQLDEQIQDCNVKMDLQSSEYSQMELNTRDSKRTLNALQSRLAEVEADSEAAQEKVLQLSQEKHSLVKRLEQVQGELQSKDLVIDEWNKTVSVIDNKVKQLSDENQTLRGDMQAFENKTHELMRQNESLADAWGRSKDEITELTSQLGKCRADLLNIPNILEEKRLFWLSQWKEEHAELIKDIKLNCSTQISYAEEKQSSAEEAIEKLKHDLQRSRSELDQLQHELRSLGSKNEQMEKLHSNEVSVKNSILRSLEDDLRKANETVAELKAKNETLGQELKHEQQMNFETVQHQEQLYARLQLKDNELLRQRKEIEKQRDDFEKAVQQLELKASEYERHWQNEQLRVENELASAKTQFRNEAVLKLKKHKSKQDFEWQQRKNEIEDIRQEFSSSIQEYVNALNVREEEAQRLNTDREHLRAALEEVQMKLCTVTEKYDSLKSKFKGLVSKYKSKEDAFSRLQSQFNSVFTSQRTSGSYVNFKP